MAVTLEDIANQTFSNIGLPTVESLVFATSGDKAVQYFKTQYESLRKSILREVPWSFATAFAALEPAGFESMFKDYAYVYKLPQDCLYARRIDKVRDGDLILFRKVKKYLYTNEVNPILEYTCDEKDVTEFDATFEVALCHRIAAELAKSVCLDQNKMQAEMQFYKLAIDMAEEQTQRESKEKKKSFNPIFDAMTS